MSLALRIHAALDRCNAQRADNLASRAAYGHPDPPGTRPHHSRIDRITFLAPLSNQVHQAVARVARIDARNIGHVLHQTITALGHAQRAEHSLAAPPPPPPSPAP